MARSRRRSAILRRAQFLLGVCEKTSTVQTIFCKAGLDESEFIRALKLAVEGDQLACRRVTEIAVSIAPQLSNSQGPKVRAASAAHEALLEDFSEMTGRRAYTWSDDTGNDDRGDFIDPLTEATGIREPGF